MAAGKLAGKMIAPVARSAAPGLAANFVRQAFDRAVDGLGPLRGAAASADHHLQQSHGDVDKAVRSIVDSHVSLAGAQGLVTNLGGLVTMAVTIPANISGLALLQCHMVAGIAHLRGYDLDDPRVRNAVLECMLGEDAVRKLVRKRKLPSTPMAVATAPAYDADLDKKVSTEVATELLSRVAGRRTATMLARRTPILGGGVGMVTDGYATYRIGRYAARELRPRPRSLPPSS